MALNPNDAFNDNEEHRKQAFDSLSSMLRLQAQQEQDELLSRRNKQAGQSAPFQQSDAGSEQVYGQMQPGGSQRGILPGQFSITQPFGNYNPGLYTGINSSLRNTGTDFGTPVGTPVALPSGRWAIEEATGRGDWNKGYGNSVLAVNEDTGEKIRFSHLSQLHAVPGQRLMGGSVVGKSGATGHVTGPHLDLEFYDPKGNVIDILKSRYARELYENTQH